MNNEITYNNYDNESIYDNENNNNNSIIPYLAIASLLLMSFGGQCLRCKFYNNNISKNLFDSGICLPSGSNMNDNELFKVSDILYNCIKKI